MTWLWILAIVAQLLDTGFTCQRLRQGGLETNPWVPQSCIGITAIKGAMFASAAVQKSEDDKKFMLTVLIVGGGVGVTLSIALKEDE